MDIGYQIKMNREQCGLTQKELADRIGVTAATITRYEQNKREPKYDVLIRICDVLNIGINNLFQEEININNYEKVLVNKIIEAKTIKELLKLSFLNNELMSYKLDKSFSTNEDKEYFFETFSEYIDSYLKSEELKTMPWINDNEDNSNGEL